MRILRLQRLREKISGYVFISKWRKGKELCIPDALLRAPVDTPKEDDLSLGNETSVCIRSAVMRSIATLRNLSVSTALDSATLDTSSGDLFVEEIHRAASTDTRGFDRLDKTYK